ALVALIQSLARLELEGDRSPPQPTAEVLAENRFLAARDGMDARLVDSSTRSLTPVRELLEGLLTECRPHALALGCARALDRVRRSRPQMGPTVSAPSQPATGVLTTLSQSSPTGS